MVQKQLKPITQKEHALLLMCTCLLALSVFCFVASFWAHIVKGWAYMSEACYLMWIVYVRTMNLLFCIIWQLPELVISMD